MGDRRVLSAASRRLRGLQFISDINELTHLRLSLERFPDSDMIEESCR